MNKLIVIVTTTFLIVALSSATMNLLFYKKFSNVKFSNSTTMELIEAGGNRSHATSCSVACSVDPTCSSFNFDTNLHTCTKNVGDIYKFGGGTLQPSSSDYYMGKIQRDVSDGDWILVFRSQANNNVSTYSVYSNQSYITDLDDFKVSSISKIGDTTSAHFRSRWLSIWPSNITQVKLELYNVGQTVLTLIFNGTGSNSTNWFSFERLIQSPFTDLVSPPNNFLLTAYPNKRFYITNANKSNDCNSKTWLLVEDNLDYSCSWSSGSTSKTFPRHMYSKTNTSILFSSNMAQGLANVMGILIKF